MNETGVSRQIGGVTKPRLQTGLVSAALFGEVQQTFRSISCSTRRAAVSKHFCAKTFAGLSGYPLSP
jgi:hypothetical protein